MRFRDLSIEQKLFLLIVPICLIPALVFVLMFGIGARATFEETMGTELTSRAKVNAERFDQFLIRRIEGLASAVHNDPYYDEGLDEARRQMQADVVVRITRNPSSSAIVQVDDALERGLGVAPDSRPGDATQVAIENGQDTASPVTLESHAEILNAVPARFPNLGPLLAARFETWWQIRAELPPHGALQSIEVQVPGRVTALPLLVCLFPIDRGPGDEAEGVVGFIYNGTALLEEFRASMPNNSQDFMVISHLGSVVYPRGLSDDMTDQAGALLRGSERPDQYFVVHRRGHPFLLAYTQSTAFKHLALPNEAGGGWRFMQVYDMQYFLAPHEERIWLSVLIALGLVLGLLALASVAARALVRPLRQLRAQTEQFAQGDLDVRAEVPGRDEIGDLAESFNLMAGRLRETYHHLEDRIEENRLRADHINAINEITSAIIQSRSLDDIFHILHQEIVKILPLDAIWLSIQVRNDRHLHVMHIEPRGLITLFDRGRLPLEQSLHGQVAQTLRAIYAEPNLDDATFEAQVAREEGLRSFLIAPMPARDRMIGTLTVASGEAGVYDDDLAEIIGSLARAVAISIEQAELFQRISHFAVELERKVAERTRELEQATRKLIQTEKYIATGRMAGNLAHEINNPLGIIKNYLQMVRNRLRRAGGGRRSTDPNIEHMEIIDEEVNRIASMVNQLLSLHRPVEHKVRPVDINEALETVLKLMEPGLKRVGVSVETELAADLACPIASPDLIRQILINLVRNAQDAMEAAGGGTLHVRTSELGEWNGRDASQSVRIRIADTGCGIEPENLSRIFDPFFTTKPQEKGSGLGLCVSYSIVRMYGGTIDVESKPGQGTTMIVTLPVVQRFEQAARLPSEGAFEGVDAPLSMPSESPLTPRDQPQKD